jgi:hypothetical protein
MGNPACRLPMTAPAIAPAIVPAMGIGARPA